MRDDALNAVTRSAPRDSSLELFRIVVMLLIVAHHYFVNSPLLDIVHAHDRVASINDVFLLFFGAWGKVGINCFVLITGYFMSERQITFEKFFKLYSEVVFYGLVCNAIFVLSAYANFSWQMVIDSLFPFRGVSSNFVAAYLIFYLLIPFLNRTLSGLSRKMHFLLVALLLGVYSVSSVFRGYRVNIDYVEWFCVVYIVGAYLRMHPHPLMKNQKCVSVSLFGALILSGVSIYCFQYLIPDGFMYFLLSDSNKPLALAVSVLAFLFFRNLHLGYSRLINTVAATTFGILLIHANSGVMRQWLWRDACKVEMAYECFGFPLIATVSVLLVFVSCALIDTCRHFFVERLFFNLWWTAMSSYIRK